MEKYHSIIIMFKPEANRKEIEAVMEEINKSGGKVIREHQSINGFSADVPFPGTIGSLALDMKQRHNKIEAIESNSMVTL